MVGLLHDRQHLDTGERGLPPPLVVERRDADQPVGALLDRKRAVGVGGVDPERRRLQASFFGVGGVVDLRRVGVALGPAQVHPHQHLGEVGRVDAACLGADRHHRLALVVLAGEQGAHLEGFEVVLQAVPLVVGLGQPGRVTFVLAELVKHFEVLEALPQLGDLAQFGLPVHELAADPLRVLDVVPQVGLGRLGLELRDIRTQSIQIHHALDAFEGVGQFLEGGGDVGIHSAQRTSPATGRPRGRPVSGSGRFWPSL